MSEAMFKPIIHTYSAGEDGALVNAYLVETQNGVVAIDATLTISDSKALRAKLESLQKPLLSILLTHPHPDHYNGVTNLLGSDKVPVISTEGVNRVIREDDAAKAVQWGPMFGDEWPPQRTFPTDTISDNETITLDGVDFMVSDLGPGESHSDSVWVMTHGNEHQAFIGDIAYNQMHVYLADGHSSEWLENLRRMKPRLQNATKLYPGHGDPDSITMLDWTESYIKTYREAVKTLASGQSTLGEDAKGALTGKMQTFLPNQKLIFMVAISADVVAMGLAEEMKG